MVNVGEDRGIEVAPRGRLDGHNVARLNEFGDGPSEGREGRGEEVQRADKIKRRRRLDSPYGGGGSLEERRRFASASFDLSMSVNG